MRVSMTPAMAMRNNEEELHFGRKKYEQFSKARPADQVSNSRRHPTSAAKAQELAGEVRTLSKQSAPVGRRHLGSHKFKVWA